MAKILCEFDDGPAWAYPPGYARDGVPRVESFPDGRATPTSEAIDCNRGGLLGSVPGEPRLHPYLDATGGSKG